MDVTNEARALVEQLAEQCREDKPIGSMSITIYDTAWVAMVSTIVNHDRHWLLPQSFLYLLDTQNEDGGWERGKAGTDRILDSMAGLLALRSHRKHAHYQGCQNPPDLDSSIQKAENQLRRYMDEWDPSSAESAGFEIIIPAMLDYLKKEDVVIDFPGAKILNRMNRTKLAKFSPEMLYSKPAIPMSVLYCLEAFAGKLDFDRISHHKVGGSMLGSPSSTAAYLIFKSTWDEEAEEYLQRTLSDGAGKGCGGFPNAFPSTVYELSWVLSTLLDAGFSPTSLGNSQVTSIAEMLEHEWNAGNGLLGFAPGLVADADDTAKTALSLCLASRQVQPDRLISEFENVAHFLTYRGERNPSVSANCNILLALLHLPDTDRYATQIAKVVKYLCSAWDHGVLKDKWNLSVHYSTMLLVRGFVEILVQRNSNKLNFLSGEIVRNKIPLTLIQALVRVLITQHDTGAWDDHSCEITAYALLTLTNLRSLPWPSSLSSQISSAVERAEQILHSATSRQHENSYVWIAKNTYCVVILSKTYRVAALYSAKSHRSINWKPECRDILFGGPTSRVEETSSLFSGISLFIQEPLWKLTASALESSLFLPRLLKADLDICPSTKNPIQEHAQYLPFIWAGCNNLRAQVDNTILWDMMLVSVLIYQIDEYMETTVAVQPPSDLKSTKISILRLYEGLDPRYSILIKGICKRATGSDTALKDNIMPCSSQLGTTSSSNAVLRETETTLARFINYFTSHPKVTAGPPSIQFHLRHGLCDFLLAQIVRLEDSQGLGSHSRGQKAHEEAANPRTSKGNSSGHVPKSIGDLAPTPYSVKDSYYDWAHTTFANYTSYSFVFTFYTSLIAPPVSAAATTKDFSIRNCFSNSRQRYVADDAIRKLAIMCRIYHDYGSLHRDREEGNLNNFDFPESLDAAGQRDGGKDDDDQKSNLEASEATAKRDLMYLADYERTSMNTALAELSALGVDEAVMEKIKLYVDVMDLYGQMYLARDLTGSVK